jgi:hypothetical protein
MNALYYPFHLCHKLTLDRLLAEFEIVHFRYFMALQLTPMMGTTAFPDRMGDYYPDELHAGRMIQGHNVSGPLTPDNELAINRDLADPQWRRFFQEFILNDYRFQRGLFADSQEGTSEHSGDPRKPEWLQFRDSEWATRSVDVETIQALSRQRLHGTDSAYFDYGWALIKTAASLIYTIQISQQSNLVAATDSSAHHHLLARTCERDSVPLKHVLVKRAGH